VIKEVPKKNMDEIVKEIGYNKLISMKDILIIVLLIVLGFFAIKALQWFMLHRKSEEAFENLILTQTGAVYRRKKEKPKKPKWKIKSVRDEVIHLYNSLCYDMALAGFERKKFFTPNEYLSEYEKEIKVDKDKFEIITKVFEKARYSQENILINEVEELKSFYKIIKGKVKDAMYLKVLVEDKKSYRV
jgi:hypothetical protein